MKYVMILAAAVSSAVAWGNTAGQGTISTQEGIAIATALLSGQPVDVQYRPQQGQYVIMLDQYGQPLPQPQPLLVDAQGRVYQANNPYAPVYYLVDAETAKKVNKAQKRKKRDRDDDDKRKKKPTKKERKADKKAKNKKRKQRDRDDDD